MKPVDPASTGLEVVQHQTRLDNTRLALAAIAIPLHFSGALVQLGLRNSLSLIGVPPTTQEALAAIALTGSFAASSILGWTMLLPLLAGKSGWRSQIACLIAIPMALLSGLLLWGLVAMLRNI